MISEAVDAHSEQRFLIQRDPRLLEAIGATAVGKSEIIGQEEVNMEDFIEFEIDMLDVSLNMLLDTKNGGTGFDYPTEKIWAPGGVSLIKRVDKDPSFKSRVNEVLDPNNLKNYVVLADMKAPTRCIDGRRIKGWAKSKALQMRGLGPKIAGATPHAALTHRIVDTDNIITAVRGGLIFDQDIEAVIEEYKKAGIGFGGHIDDHAEGWNTGCGAVDNINKILEKVQLPEPQQQIRGLVRTILGDAYDTSIVNEVFGRMLLLDAIKPKYMPKENDDPKGEFLYKRTVIETIKRASEEQHEPVEQLEGRHHEVALIINNVDGTTLDTDRLSYDTDDEIQVFGWDVWEIFNEAERLFPASRSDSFEAQQQTIRNRAMHVTVRTILGVATAMVLTDGSLRLGVMKTN